MDRGARFFWAILLCLVVASTYFGLGAERMRGANARERTHGLESGDIVALVQVVDGDTVAVKEEGGKTEVVRLVGIKAFSADGPRDASTEIGGQAVRTLTALLQERAVRVVPADPPRDRKGRVLAHLESDGRDVALELVDRGLALVYVLYPFPDMGRYLEHQALARAEHRGLWVDSGLSNRADTWLRDWEEGRE